MAQKKTPFKQYMGQQIRALRDAAGLTQMELAVRLGVTPAHISLWETGQTMPDSKYLEKICEEFKVKMAFNPIVSVKEQN
jgi:transcriptional regulator with XRE-family HTH domain